MAGRGSTGSVHPLDHFALLRLAEPMNVRMQQDHPHHRHEDLEVFDEEVNPARPAQDLRVGKARVGAQFLGTRLEILIVVAAEESLGLRRSQKAQ